MKSLTYYIQEKLVIKKSTSKKNKTTNYKYFPESKDELKNIISKRIKDEGNEVDLNDIDVSEITDMSNLFERTDFNGDISNWDVSNVKNMYGMFYKCTNFNTDISDWDVSNVTNMGYMFCGCESFNQDISAWDVSNVKDMGYMFYGCKLFNYDISNWNVSNVKNNIQIFAFCQIEEKYKPKFK